MKNKTDLVTKIIEKIKSAGLNCPEEELEKVLPKQRIYFGAFFNFEKHGPHSTNTLIVGYL